MTWVRLALVAALAYSLGARDWTGVVGAAATLAAAELGWFTHHARARAAARQWREQHPA